MVNPDIQGVLSDYLAITSNHQLSRCKVASTLKTQDFDDEKSQWDEHQRLRTRFWKFYRDNSSLNPQDIEGGPVKKSFFSYLDLKVQIAEKIYQNCILCEKMCHVDRTRETGECGVTHPLIASEFLHVGEEPPLVPSHTIFFTGCNFQCVYCQNWDISQRTRGIPLSEEELAGVIEKRRREGSRNVNFVGGDPTPNLPYILRTMRRVRENIPVVWNSNMYLSQYAMHLLDGFVDLYLTDFKYGNDACAQRLSGIPNYMETVGRNHKLAQKSGDMIIRHLVLPNHVECCSKPLLDWISRNLGLDVVLNIMGQYHPVYHAPEYGEISRALIRSELVEVINYAQDLGFRNVI
ncbi:MULTISPECIES: radical SAM protein [unclassified Methanobacterium]|uniref:radical SAM protein n=1 Tax=unclassified Methanobacterium TaxID=2627676 RepID=UPI000748AF5C|nr:MULTISPECIES: radical SAM protein [unclassified Methanobacterium]KUK72297.1 MAG: Radical SAM domain protein [Methanobacterium sp. 42_16]